MEQQLDEPPADPSLDHSGDTIVGTVRQVRQSPARIGEHLYVWRVTEVLQGAEGRRHPLEGRRRLSAAEVRQGPCRVPHHGRLVRLLEHCHDWVQASALQNQVPEVGRVAGDVAQRPDGLLPHVVARRLQQLHEDGQSSMLNDDPCLLCRARGDVREYPRCLKLQVRTVYLLQEAHEARDHPGCDHLLDRGILLNAQQLSELLRRIVLSLWVVRHEPLAQLRDLLDSKGRACSWLHWSLPNGSDGIAH
mmetsp:Transcript_26984/g.59221  ORF Transcript_26984/g.59221 Transcript_26984/m.59221 type:complete len:248 (-) Transcript_26984:251-994(-)